MKTVALMHGRKFCSKRESSQHACNHFGPRCDVLEQRSVVCAAEGLRLTHEGKRISFWGAGGKNNEKK